MNKKRLIIIVSIIAIIIIGIIVFFVLRNKKDREYTVLTVNNYTFWNLYADERAGVIRKDGEIIIEPKYDDIKIPNQDIAVFITTLDDKTEVYNDRKEKILTNYNNISAIEVQDDASQYEFDTSVLKYEENGKFGIVNFEGKKITDPIYEEIISLPNKFGELRVKKDGKYGVISNKGIELVDIKYDSVEGDGYSKDNSYKQAGYIVGEKTSDGMKYGYIDRNEKEILKIEQESIGRITDIGKDDVYLIVSKNGRYAIYKNKENLTDYIYLSIDYNSDSETFIVNKNKRYGLLSKDLKTIIPTEYDELLVAGMYVNCSKNGENITFDLEGKKVETSDYISLEKTLTGKYFICMNTDYLYGILDKDKNVVIENQYDYIREIENTDLILATKDDDITIYSANINEIISVENASMEIVNNYIKVIDDKDIHYFSLDGKEVDNKTVYLENEIFAQKESGKWGFINLLDEEVVDNIYDEVTEVNEYGFAGIKKDGKWGVINSKGDIVLEPTYESEIKNPIFIGKYMLNGNIVTDEF